MGVTHDLDLLSVARLTSALRDGGAWTRALPAALGVSRIGAEFGAAGRSYHVIARLHDGSMASLVAKVASTGLVRRERAGLEAAAHALGDGVPELLGEIEGDAECGALLLERITPAEQGDVLRGCSLERVLSVVRLLALLHAHGPVDSLPPWSPAPLDADVWRATVHRAAERYPDVVTQDRIGWLEPLPDVASAVMRRVAESGTTLCHGDAHLDNVLFRADGEPVLLDWATAHNGPPFLDVARFLAECGGRAWTRVGRREIVAAYHAARPDCAESDTEAFSRFQAAVIPLARGAVQWAGTPGAAPPTARLEAARRRVLFGALLFFDDADAAPGEDGTDA